MDRFQLFIRRHFFISFGFFIIGILFGIIYSINLLGYSFDSQIVLPTNFRSLHITYMLYGFVPLMLSLLPFVIIHKDRGISEKGLEYLEKYFITWYIFLVLAFFSLFLGVVRGLAFYDFAYGLNFILAFSGVFYILALYHFINLYDKKPLWIKVSLVIVLIAPIALIILMNPTIGQVEKTVSGPHGDNTLGMSFTLLPIYYLIIKYLSIKEFKPRWNILWMIPLFFYILSVLYRSFIGNLTYEQEWFCQYLTLLYLPLLYRWYKDADIDSKALLLISLLSFAFIDIEGNILFIPEIRWVFHRNDLVVAHAHIAMGISILFMAFSICENFVKELESPKFYLSFLSFISLLVLFLSLNGFVEVGYLKIDTQTLWLLRTISGIGALISLFTILDIKVDIKNYIKLYHLGGFLGDGIAILFLILFGDIIYKYLGFYFDGVNSYIVYSFVFSIGLIHFIGYLKNEYAYFIAMLTMLVRVVVGSAFISLYLSNKMGFEALFIGGYDLAYATIYLMFFHKTTQRIINV